MTSAVESALGGSVVGETLLDCRRVPIRVRHARDGVETVWRVLVPADVSAAEESDGGPTGPVESAARPKTRGAHHSTARESRGSAGARVAASPLLAATSAWTPPVQVPLAELASIRVTDGPAMLRSEDGILCSYVQLNVHGRDVVGFVEAARRAVDEEVRPPDGVRLAWSGQFEHQVRARRTLSFVVPAVVALIFGILWLTYRDAAHALLV